MSFGPSIEVEGVKSTSKDQSAVLAHFVAPATFDDLTISTHASSASGSATRILFMMEDAII